MAGQVTKANCDENALNRATAALTRISRLRTTENESEDHLLTAAQRERGVRSAYAEAYASPSGTPINGTFETPYGQILLKQDGPTILGQMTLEDPVLRAVISNPSGITPSGLPVKTVKFSASTTGRAGTFNVDTSGKSTLLGLSDSVTAQGLIILASDGESFEILEEQDTEVNFYKARKIQI